MFAIFRKIGVRISTKTIRKMVPKTLNSVQASKGGQLTKDKANTTKKLIKGNLGTVFKASVIIAVASLLIAGNRIRQTNEEPTVSRAGDYTPIATLDNVSAADLAATIARDANLLIADNVRNQADSLSALSEFAAAETYLEKPQVIATDAKTKTDIVEYTVQKGDTLDLISRRFNVTTDTIRWENSITGSPQLSVGRKITILPVTGLSYTIKAGDTAKSLASSYEANAAQITAFNDAEINGLKAGQKIIIPNGKRPAPVIQQPVYVATGQAATASTGFSFGNQPLYGGNGYSYGYCTWHAANRRLALGRPIPRNLGNAVTWATLGARAGMNVSGEPIAGAVLWHKNSPSLAGGLGHVGFVESVNPGVSVTVSDMNYPIFNVQTTRTIPWGERLSYLYLD